MNQEKIGRFIAVNRKKKKLTQSDLAEKLGVTDRSVSNWENGKNMPDLSLFKPLCDILGITINELLSGENVEEEDYKDKLEENFINTIVYVDKKNMISNDRKSILWLIVGILIVILSQLLLNNYDVQNYINIVGLVLVVYSLKRLCLKYKLVRKLVALLLVIIAILCFIFI